MKNGPYWHLEVTKGRETTDHTQTAWYGFGMFHLVRSSSKTGLQFDSRVYKKHFTWMKIRRSLLRFHEIEIVNMQKRLERFFSISWLEFDSIGKFNSFPEIFFGCNKNTFLVALENRRTSKSISATVALIWSLEKHDHRLMHRRIFPIP